MALYLGTLSSMSFDDKLEILLLIPKMDTAIGSTRVADTILVESGRVKLCLLELSTEGTISEQLLASIRWIPELK